jgi:hypothetical protein
VGARVRHGLVGGVLLQCLVVGAASPAPTTKTLVPRWNGACLK